jgi:hypothetical protein
MAKKKTKKKVKKVAVSKAAVKRAAVKRPAVKKTARKPKKAAKRLSTFELRVLQLLESILERIEEKEHTIPFHLEDAEVDDEDVILRPYCEEPVFLEFPDDQPIKVRAFEELVVSSAPWLDIDPSELAKNVPVVAHEVEGTPDKA